MDKAIDERLKKLEKFQSDCELEERVEKEVSLETKARCATAYSCLLGFIALLGGIITFYSETVRDASKAAVKVIIMRIWQ